MSETSQKWSVKVIAGLGLGVLALAFVGGRFAGSLSDLGGPLTDGRLYEVPVSISQPKRGPADALVTIVEWCDLQGETCKASDKLTSAIMADHKDEVRHVFRHFADASSEDSLRMHEFGRIVLEQFGKFWEVREHFLARPAGPLQTAELERIAKAVDLDWGVISKTMEKGTFRSYVRSDGLFAQRFGVTKPATIYVNGRRLIEPVTRERLDALVDLELARAKKVVAKGVKKSGLYAELTKGGLFEPPAPVVAQTH